MDPYSGGQIIKNPYASKRIVQTSVVAILQLEMKNRGLNLIQQRSRALKKNEIHELMVTDEKEIQPGGIVNAVAYLAFVEIIQGGVIIIGDEVYWNQNPLGVVAGFDDTHMPNHQNIILFSTKKSTGADLNIQLGDQIFFKQ